MGTSNLDDVHLVRYTSERRFRKPFAKRGSASSCFQLLAIMGNRLWEQIIPSRPTPSLDTNPATVNATRKSLHDGHVRRTTANMKRR